MQPFAAGIGERLGLRCRAVVEHGGARHVAAQQPHALAVLQIDGGKKDHRGRGFSASGPLAPPSIVVCFKPSTLSRQSTVGRRFLRLMDGIGRRIIFLTKLGVREGGAHRAERGAARSLAVAKAADGPLECLARSSFARRRTPSRGGAADGKPVLGFDAKGPCAWTGRAPRMMVAGGEPAIHRPLRGPARGCGQPRTAASATNARWWYVRSGETGKLVSPFSFVRGGPSLGS
jgi:hypothetical protein